MTGLLVSKDFLFISKVTGTASLLGKPIEVVPDAAAALERLRAGGYGAVLVDLAGEVGDLTALCRPADGPPPHVIAFGSHVDTARLAAAREAGCTEVMPRSKFSATLPEILKGLP